MESGMSGGGYNGEFGSAIYARSYRASGRDYEAIM
jgi:hypothetical protein